MNAPPALVRGFSALTLLLGCLLSGCNLQALLIRGTVDATAEFTEERGTAFADPEIIGPILATATATNEGLIYFVPDYEPLLMGAIFSNVAYGVGWLQAEARQAELDGNYDAVEHLNKRSGILFARAMFYAKRLLRLRDEDFDAAMSQGVDVFSQWVDENFYEKEDAEPLMTASLAYLVAMIESEEGLAAAVDLPYARVMIERSIELDQELSGGQGMMMIGVIECTMPAAVGGRPKVGLRLMEKAAKVDDRGNHGILIAMAERCAVALQDRALFTRLLMEVIEAGDVEKYRLPNKLARHEAERLLKQADEFFYD